MPSRKIRFAAFEADLLSGELRKHGIRIKLQDQPFKILAALLERPGDIVTREELRARIWGDGTFVDFDHGLSAAVNRLRDALGDSAASPRYVETVARRGYRFIAATVDEAPPPAPRSAPPEAPAPAATPFAPEPPLRHRPWAAVLAAVLLLAGGLGFYRVRHSGSPPRLSQITALTGSETMPTLSPDGRQLAYVWNGEKERDANIYVKLLGTENALQLTHSPAPDLLPSWSPDGRQIAFIRVDGTTALYLVSPLGGPERRILELPGIDRRPKGPETRIVGDLLYPIASRPSWSPDSKYLAFTRTSEPPEPGDGAVLLVPADGSAPRTLLAPPAKGTYRHPTFSPDGRRLAVDFCSAPVLATCQIQLVDLTPDYRPASAPATLHAYQGQLRGIAWMPDGESLLVGGFQLPRYYTWRIAVDKPAPPERVELAGIDAIWPTVSPNGSLAFTRNILQADLWRWDKGGKPYPILSSTARDTNPVLSPDGARVAFQSGRSGLNEIWAARLDGSGLTRLTNSEAGSRGAPDWSPDGKWIAYDASRNDVPGTDIWVADAATGLARRLTQPPEDYHWPTWSHDGRSIYVRTSRPGSSEIWRLPVAGGPPVQIASHGSGPAREAPDGRSVVFLVDKGDPARRGLYSLPLAGGEPRQLVSGEVIRYSFDVTRDGIYYIAARDEDFADLRFYDFATARVHTVESLERPIAFGLSVAPDQKTYLYSRPVTGSDLYRIENLR